MLCRSTLFAALALAVSMACNAPAPTLTIVHFNDVYEIGPAEGGRVGGLARVATVINDLKRSNGAVITTLGGDFLSPSALSTAIVDGQPMAGRQMVDVLNRLGLQWATFGNHEFDLSEEAFRSRLQELQFSIVASNVTDAQGELFPGTQPFAIIPVQVDGRPRRIGLIGLTIAGSRRPWVAFTDPVAAATRAIALMRETGAVDAIVALTHLTLGQDQTVVTEVPDIDVVLGGHEHENWLVYRGEHLTPIIKADANVRTVAVVSLSFPDNGRPTVSTRLQSIDERISPDSVVETEVNQWTKRAFDAFRAQGFEPERVVANLTERLDGRESTVRNGPGNLTDLIAEAMAVAADPVDVALLNGGSVRIDDQIPPGPFTEYDAMRVLPFGNVVSRVTMPGSLLTRILEVGENNRGSGGFLHVWGASRAGTGWTVQGKPVIAGVRYRVAMTDFLLTGGETGLDFLTRDHPLIRDAEDLMDVRQALIAELGRKFPN